MAAVNKVVIPVDFSSSMDKVVDYGMSIADNLGAKVLFFHVVSDFQGYDMMLVHPSFLGMTKDIEEQAEERMAALVKEHEGHRGGVVGEVVIGNAADGILQFAEVERADMIIIGTHGTKGLERILMGSTAERVVKKAPCPVLIFNPFK